MPKETAREWHLRHALESTTRENEGLKGQLSDARREAQAARRSGSDSERAARELTHQLHSALDRAKIAENTLQQLQDRNRQSAQEKGGMEARALTAEAELVAERSQRQAAESRNGQLDNLVREQGQTIELQGQQLDEAAIIKSERDGLLRDHKSLVRRVHVLTSQVGNVFVAGSAILRRYYHLETLKALPLVGSLFGRASQRAYQAYLDSKRQPESH